MGIYKIDQMRNELCYWEQCFSYSLTCDTSPSQLGCISLLLKEL